MSEAQRVEDNQDDIPSDPNQEIDNETGKSYEEIAISQGWASEEAWMGDPKKHINAKTFVERGRTSIPLMKASMKNMSATIEELRTSITYQNDFHAKETQRLKDGFEADMKAAVKEGDEEAYDNAKKSLDAIPDAPTAPVTQQVSAEEIAFGERNEWYGTDDVMTGAAIVESARLMKEVPGLTQAQHDAQIERFIAKEFAEPEIEGDPPLKRKPGSPVSKPRRNAPSQRTKTWNDLPEDAHVAFDGFVRSGVFKNSDEDRKRYLNDYKWDD